jgi:hypothetical protein
MSWRDWFSIESWFFTTAAAQGLRDARHDYPREDTYVETSALVQPVTNSTRLARDVPAGEKAASSAVLRLAPYEFEELKIAETRIDRICEATEHARQRYEARLNHVQHRIQDLLREALKNRTAHAAKHFAQPHPLMPMWLYVLVMLVMGAAELLFNATAFRLIESGQDYQSYIMAVAPTLSLLMMAHFLGVKWRQWPRDQVWKNAAVAVAIFVTITVASYALGIMRAEFVEVKGAEAGARAAAEAQLNAADERVSLERQVEDLRGLARTAQDKGPSEDLVRAEQALAQKLVEERALAQKTAQANQVLADARHGLVAPNLRHVLMLFAINMLILMTGAFASYYTHDGDRELERVVRQKARLRRELSRWWGRWAHAAARYDRIVKTARERINRIMHEFEALVGEYRFYNTRKRDKYPAFFRDQLAGRTFLVRSFGPEADPTPIDLRQAFEQIENELLADSAPAAAAQGDASA